MKDINIAYIGVGKRGTFNLKLILNREYKANIVAVCDAYEDRAIDAANLVEEKGRKRPDCYTDYKEAITRDDVNTVIICSAWENHIEAAIFAMNHNKAVAIEVGGAYNLKECFDLVEAWENTKVPFMMLENCCFGKKELLAYNMAKAGIFGEVVHCHGAYGHDLREEVVKGKERRHYRLKNYIERNCENYPTHELGPIAKILNINAGNKMNKLISVSSKSVGIKHYINERLEEIENKDLIGVEFKQGDIVNTIITCENGETISLKLDTTLPRYYSREFTVRGTKAMYEEVLNSIYTDGEQEFWETDEFVKNYTNNVEKYYDEHLPPFWKKITEEETKNGHGGMDAYEFDVFFHCLENDIPSPIDVYDAASWMAITPLSEESIKTGKAVEVPDFTKGKWKERKVTPINIL